MFKNKTLKQFIIFAIIIFLSSLIAGCGGGSGGPGVSLPPAPTFDSYPGYTPYLTPTPTPPAGTTKLYVVLVGIADYPGDSPGPNADLIWTVKDVNDFYNALKDCNLWKETTVTVDKLTNLQATKANIINALNTAKTSVTEDDMFVFCYSGHGTHYDNGTYDTGYLVCYDGIQIQDGQAYAVESGCLSQDELESLLSAIPAATKKYIVMDSCFSGLMIDKAIESNKSNVRIKYIPMKNSNPNMKFKGAFSKSLTGLSNIVCVTACAGDEVSYESGALQNGVLIHYMVEGLANGSVVGLADANHNSSISAEETYNYAAPKITFWADIYTDTGQHPQVLDNFFGELAVKE